MLFILIRYKTSRNHNLKMSNIPQKYQNKKYVQTQTAISRFLDIGKLWLKLFFSILYIVDRKAKEMTSTSQKMKHRRRVLRIASILRGIALKLFLCTTASGPENIQVNPLSLILYYVSKLMDSSFVTSQFYYDLFQELCLIWGDN